MNPPSEQKRVKLMKDICLQNNIEWQSEWALEASTNPPTLQDSKRIERDEGNIKTQREQTVPSIASPLKVEQDIKPHYNRGSVSDGSGHGSLPTEQVSNINMRVSASIKETYDSGTDSNHGSFPKEEVARVNMRASDEPYESNFGSKHSFTPKERVPRVNMRIFENEDDPYTSASPRYNPTQGSLPRDEVMRSDLRASDRMHQPYNRAFGAPLQDKATKANMKGGTNEPYKPEFVPMNSKEASRANVQSMEEIYKPDCNPKKSSSHNEEHEPVKPYAAPFGHHRVADYKEATHEDRAEYLMQHPDEISDSGSDIFVSVEDEDVALFHKEGASRTSNVARNSFQGTREDNSSNSNFKPQASRDTGFNMEGYHRGNSLSASSKENSMDTNQSPCQKPSTDNRSQKHRNKWVGEHSFQEPMEKSFKAREKEANRNHWEGPKNQSCESNTQWVEKVVRGSAALSPELSDPLDEDDFASTAKAIATEAARLAVLNYAKQYSRSRSLSKDVDDLTVENRKDNVSYSKPEGIDIDCRMKGMEYKSNRSNVSVFDEEQDFTKERPHRSTYGEGIPDPQKQHQFSLRIFTEENISSTKKDNYFNEFTRDEKLTYPNQMPLQEKSQRSSRPPHNEHHHDKWATSASNEDHDKRRPTRSPQSINHNYEKNPKWSVGARGPAMHDKVSGLSIGPHHSDEHEENMNSVEKGKLGTSSSRRGAPNQAKEHSERTPFSGAVNVKGDSYGIGKPPGWALKNQVAVREENLLEMNMEEQKGKAFDGQDAVIRSPMMIHRHSEKSVVDEMLSARWHREEPSGKTTQQDKEERFWGSEESQNRPQEPVTRSKVLAKDSITHRKNPSQHDQDANLASLYKPHDQVDDLLKRVPSNPISVRQKPQGRREEVQSTASSYRPYVRKQEAYEEDHKPPSKQNNPNQPHQQVKYQGKQDSHKYDEEDASGISPNCLNKPHHHDQVDDLLKRVPSNPISVHQKPQGHREGVQSTESSYRLYVQKQEAYEEDHKPPSKQHNPDRPHQQVKYQCKQDCHKYEEEDASGISPNRLHKPHHHDQVDDLLKRVPSNPISVCQKPQGRREEVQSTVSIYRPYVQKQEAYEEDHNPPSKQHNPDRPHQQAKYQGMQDSHKYEEEDASGISPNHLNKPHHHGQVDDLHKRVPSNPISVRQKPQGCREEVQSTASSYRPHVQKQEAYEEDHKPPSKQHNPDQPHQQEKYQGKQGSHKYEEEDASGISPNRLHKPYHHDQVDFLKRVPSNPISVHQKPQGRREDVQSTASSYRPYVQKQEAYEEDHKPLSKQHNPDRPHQQAKYQGKQDSHKYEEEDASGISPNRLHKPHHHDQVDDLLKRVPSNPISVRQKPQGCWEEVQSTASSYRHVQKQETYEEDHKPPSKQHNPDRPHQQAKYQGKQDSHKYEEEDASGISPNCLHKPHPKHHEEGHNKEHKQYDREHKKPTSFMPDHGKQDEAHAMRMNPSHVSEPPTRKPPPLPQRNETRGADWEQQHSMYGNQKKQVGLRQEEAGAYERDNSEKIDRRAMIGTRPPPPVITRASETERAEKESWARPPPEAPTWRKSPSSTPASSDAHNVFYKPPSPKPPMKPAASKMSEAPAPAPTPAPAPVPKITPKFPHVDDIAANLEALRKARFQ